MINEKRLRLLFVILGVLLAAFVVIIALVSAGSDKEAKGEKESEKTSTTEEETNKTEEALLAPISEEDDVYKLVLSYIDAAYIKCDEEALKAMMDSYDNINMSKNEPRQRYIEAYNNIKCYLLDGKDNMNVVYVTYEAKLYNYDDMLPSGEAVMIVKDTEGKYKIHNLLVGEQFESNMTNDKQVAELANIQEKIQSEYNAVISSNTEIKSIVDILNGVNNEQKEVE